MLNRKSMVALFLLVPLLTASWITGCGGSSSHSNSSPPPPPPALTISQVFPATGAATGSTSVTVTGTGFVIGSTTVDFGGTAGTSVNVQSATTLTVVTPAHAAGVVNVTVTVSGTTATLSNGFTYTTGGGGGGGGGTTMTFSSIFPTSGAQGGGTPLTITGTNFANISMVTLGGTALTGLMNPSTTTITGTTGAHAPGAVALQIFSTTMGTLSVPNAFSYVISSVNSGSMMLTNITPSNGALAGGNTITIAGTSFLSSMTVSIDGNPCGNIVVNPTFTSLTCTVPAAPAGFSGGAVNVTLTSTNASAGSVSLLGYTYNGVGGAVTLTAITPTTAPETGLVTTVTITGTNFKSGLLSNVRTVLIGGNDLLNIQIPNATTITGLVPPGTVGPTTVVVIATNGTSSAALPFTYTASLVVNGLNPNQGPTSGGPRSVTVRGQNFTTADVQDVLFDGIKGTSVVVIDSMTLTVIPPASRILSNGQSNVGGVDVIVEGIGIGDGSLHLGYNYGPTFNPVPAALSTSTGAAVATVGSIAVGQFVTGAPTGCVVITPGSVALFPQGSSGPVVGPFASGSASLGGATFTNLMDVALADVNGDGLPDVFLLQSGAGANTVIVLTNNGNATFSLVGGEPAGGYAITNAGTATSFCLGIFNPNGFYDAAVTMAGSDTISILQGGAGGTLTDLGAGKQIAFAAGAAPTRVLCADPHKFTTDPMQTRTDDDNGPQGLDLNHDGRADLVCCLSGADQVAVLLQDAVVPFQFNIAQIASCGTGTSTPRLLALADVDEDGHLDVVCGNTGTGNLSVFLGNGSGAIALVATYSVQGPGVNDLQGLAVADFNRDCRPDIVTSNLNGSNISIYLGQGDGTFADATNYEAESTANRAGARIVAIRPSLDFGSIVGLDANGTQNKDFLVTVPRAFVLYVQGDPVTPPYFTAQAEQDPQGICFGDLNGDGRNDMVVANRAAGTIMVFLNDRSGNFTQPFAPIATGLQPESVAIADVNNDGMNDVLVACNGSDAVYVHLNLAGGSLAAGTAIATNAKGPHQVLAVDMNGDGNVDFVTVNQYGNSVSCFLGDGTGGFAPAPGFAPASSPAGVYPVGNAPLGVAVADLNGDGKIDIVTANSNADTVTVLLRNPVGPNVTILSAKDYFLGGLIQAQAGPPALPILLPTIEPVSVAIGDLNKDGANDIVTADKAAGTVTILHGKINGGTGIPNGDFYVPTDYFHYGNATAIGTPPVKLACGASPIQVLLADMNNDHNLDIVVATFGGQSIVDFIAQPPGGVPAKTQTAATGPMDLNLPMPPTPPTALTVLDVVPAGETTFVFDPVLGQVLYKTGKLVTFSGAVGQPITSMAIGRLTADCPPQVGVTSPSTDDMVRVFKLK
jgi:hypothetical protein